MSQYYNILGHPHPLHHRISQKINRWLLLGNIKFKNSYKRHQTKDRDYQKFSRKNSGQFKSHHLVKSSSSSPKVAWQKH